MTKGPIPIQNRIIERHKKIVQEWETLKFYEVLLEHIKDGVGMFVGKEVPQELGK